MAYLIYRTDFDNTIIRETPTNTASGGTELSILKSLVVPPFILPENQPTYYWKVILPTTVSPNTDAYINLWEAVIASPPSPGTIATIGYVTGITSPLENNINYISGVTDTKLNISAYSAFTATTGLQQVTQINAITNIESSFNGGLKLHKIRPTGNTTTAIQINKADGVTNIINVDTVSGLTGFGTIAPADKIHLYGTDIGAIDEYTPQKNGLTLDGVTGADKAVTWNENGVAHWQAETYRDENSVFWYLANVQAQSLPLVVMETGRIGVNKQSNFLNYHAAEVVSVTGLDDLIVSGVYTENYNSIYEVQIVSTGVTDSWEWRASIDNGITYGSWSSSSGCTLTPVLLEYGVYINFENLTGHGIGATWRFAAFSQIPQGTFTIAPALIPEVQTTNNIYANPILYKDITAKANGGLFGETFTIFNSGTGGTIQALYLGFLVNINSVFFDLNTFDTTLTLVAQYWNSNISGWTTLNFATNHYIDGTSNLSKSGKVIWTPSTMTGWQKDYLPDLNESGYQLLWIRFITTTNPTNTVNVNAISVGNDKRFSIYNAFNDYRPSTYIDSQGRMNIGGGNITGSNKLQVNCGNCVSVTPTGTDSLVEFDSENSAVVDLKLKLSSNDICPPGLTLVKTRGTLDSSSGITTGDILGNIKFRGRIGTSGRLLSEIKSEYTGNGTTRYADVTINTANGSDPTEKVRVTSSGTTGFGVVPTAIIHSKAGTLLVPPRKYNPGPLTTTKQSGSVEFNGNNWFGTTTGLTRNTFAFLESPIFTGNPELPNTTTLNNINLCNYIWNSGGTNNSCLVKTCTFNTYTGSTLRLCTVTGATNGLSKSGSHEVKLGGTLTAPVIISGNQNFCLDVKRIDIASSEGAQIFDKNGCSIEFYSSGGTVSIKGMTSAGAEALRLQMSDTQATLTDSRVSPRGIEYNADYSCTYTARSLPDKAYVDSVATGLRAISSALVATTGNIVLSGLTTVDGITLSNGNRVLAKDQTVGSANGMYIATGTTWSRAVDYNFSPAGEISNGDIIPVISGTTNGNTIWVLTTPDPINSGDTLTFSLFSKISAVIAGVGINVSQSSGNYNVCVKPATNSGLCADGTGLYLNSGIAGTGLNYTTGVLSVCGSNLAGNSISWTGNTFNVNPATGTLNTALNSKLNVSTYCSYTGATATAISCRLLTSIYQTYTGTTVPTTYQTIANVSHYTGTTAPNTYYNKTQINSYTGETKTTLDAKAYLSGATFTGVVNVCKAAQNDNTNCVATTSWYISQGGTANALMDGTAGCGISNLFARQDHVHPTDTSRLALTIYQTYTGTTAPNTFAPKASPTFTGTVTIPTPFTLGAVSVKTTGTELNYLTGVTSDIQSQFNLKANTASPTFTGTVTIPTPFILGAISVKTTGTELNYVTGVTNNIQTQLNAKAPIISPTFTVSAKSVTPIVNNNDVCIATTAWYFGQAGNVNPLMDGIATSGNSTCWSRQNHVHPTDTSRLALTIYQTYTGTTVPTTYQTIANVSYYTGTTAPNTFAPKASPTFTGTVTIPTPFVLGAVSVKTTGTELNYLTGVTSDIQAQINLKANLASPKFTGVPSGTTAAVNTNTVQLATTAFVLAQASRTNPLMDGIVTSGTSFYYSRQDHVHPRDTTKASLSGATFTGGINGELGLTISGATINLNHSSNFATNINDGTSTGTITLGGTGIQTIDIGANTGVKTINIGSNATPANAIGIGGANSIITIGGVETIIGIAGSTAGNGVRIGSSRVILANKPTTPTTGLNTNTVMSLTQLLEAGIIGFATTNNRTLTFPTAQGATGIVQNLPNAQIGDIYEFIVFNTGGNNVTLVAGTGVTIVNTAVINAGTRRVVIRVTGVTAGSETISVY